MPIVLQKIVCSLKLEFFSTIQQKYEDSYFIEGAGYIILGSLIV
jgi:hypothetical protein